MSVIGKIRTPRGRRISVGSYVALANRNEQVCEHGHFSCAAWDHGPCSDELLSAIEADDAHLINENP